MIYTTHYPSPLGDILLAAKDNKLIGLWIEGQKYYLANLKEEITEDDSAPVLIQTKDWLDRYFNGKKPEPAELPLAPIGSDFRQQVWQILKTIPYGETTTYKQIAEQIAKQRGTKQMSAQAVGGAVGHNPISIIIPCHRVLGSDGSLTGYAGGLDKKTFLLNHERACYNKTIAGGKCPIITN
ncbi:methylated-DNA--[Candidatus Saccharibacteria bacterium]|nr:methylated-DNA--[protein]-cysteine S-methyltransferase [Candidatus Saccharibacteria bacterium]